MSTVDISSPIEDSASVRQRFLVHLQGRQLKLTRQREIILEEFLCQDDHVSAEELHNRMKVRHPELGQATVFRTLHLIAEAGLAQEVRIDARTTRYERVTANSHHDHIQCIACGAVFEFLDERLEALQTEIASRFGVELHHHRMDLFGICTPCRQKEVKK